MYVEVAKMDDVALGGMKAVRVQGKEIVLCNYDGKIYAVSRRCGHTNAPLEMGTLEGYILTCPLHYSQFDIRIGELLSGPVPRDFGDEPLPDGVKRYFDYAGPILDRIMTYDIETYKVKMEGDSIKVEV